MSQSETPSNTGASMDVLWRENLERENARLAAELAAAQQALGTWHRLYADMEARYEQERAARKRAERERGAAMQREMEQRALVDSIAARLARYDKGDVPDGDLLDLIEAADERVTAAEREVEQCHAKATCMCGSYMKDHSGHEGHTGVSMYDHALDRAEARIAAALEELDGYEDVEDRPNGEGVRPNLAMRVGMILRGEGPV